MSATDGPLDPVDSARSGGALAGAAGLASIAWPYFEGMAAAILAIALVGWAFRGRRTGRPSRLPSLRRVASAVAASSSVLVLLLLPGLGGPTGGASIGLAGAVLALLAGPLPEPTGVG